MAVKDTLLVLVSALACAALVQGACNNMQLSAEAPCCQGSLVGNACGTAGGAVGKCVFVETSNWVTQYNPDSLMCKLNTCKKNADCLDANYCTTDSCVSGKCVRTTQRGCVACKTGYHPGVCNDGNTCTQDSCVNVSMGWLSKCKHSAPAPGCVPAIVPKYGQCGGLLYTGSKRCAAGTTCQKQYSHTQADPSKLTLNPYYSQCL